MVMDRRSIYFLRVDGAKTKLTFNGAKLIVVGSVIAIVLLVLNILGSCLFSISCGRFLPTVSFVGSLITHDKILVATCTFCLILSQAVVVSVLTELQRGLSLFDTVFTYLSMTLFSILLLCATIVDEVNGFVVRPMEGFHIFYSFSALVVGLTWLYFVLDRLSCSRLKSSVWLQVSKKLFIVLGVVTILVLTEWQLANSIYWNFFLNENVEAICEWVLLCLALATPAVVVQALPEFTVSLSLHSV
mmetsp:Transcript_15834/g.29003  ORF Transcript_15834/g.29003 Transcript_15834/m.29003 type:complete len:245 (+) Transcript_15834:790-1524(+)